MRLNGHFATRKSLTAHVRFGSKAHIHPPLADVRFTPKSRHSLPRPACPRFVPLAHIEVPQLYARFIPPLTSATPEALPHYRLAIHNVAALFPDAALAVD